MYVCVCANAKNNRGVKHRTNNTSTGACSNQTVFKNMIVLTMWSQFLGFFFSSSLFFSHRRFPSSSSADVGGSNSLQSSPIRILPHWNSQSSMPSTPDLRSRTPHYVHSTRSVSMTSGVFNFKTNYTVSEKNDQLWYIP